MREHTNWAAELRQRLGVLKLTPEREVEILEELSQHLDDRLRELTQGGMDPAVARHQALDELSAHPTLAGDFAHLRQAASRPFDPPGQPGHRFFPDLWRDVLYSVRILARQPGFAAAAILTLALGIGANTAIFSLVNAALFQRLPVHDRDRLVYVWNGRGPSVFSYPAYAALRNGGTLLEGLSAWGGITASLNADGVTDLAGGVIVTGNYFALLGVEPLRGRLLTVDDDVKPGGHPVAVLSHRFWQSRFSGRPDIVGHGILLNGHAFTIVGVTRPEFVGAEVGIIRDIYVPMMMQADMRPPRAGYSGEMNPDLLKNPNNGWLSALGKLKPGVTPAQVTAELSAVLTEFARRTSTNGPGPPRVSTAILVDDGNPGQRQELRAVAWLLSAVVFAVLLIACANVANLLLSRVSARRRELAVRLAIGASRGRIVRQLLTESVLLSLFGGGVGLALAWATVALFRAAPPPAGALPIALDFGLDLRVLLFCSALSLLTGVVFGLAPALSASRPVLVPSLKDSSFTADGRARRFGVRKILVLVEVGLAVPLLVAAGLFVRSLNAERAVDSGMDAAHLLSAPLNVNLLRYTSAQGRDFYDRVIERASALPGAESATVARLGPLSGGGRTLSFLVEGKPPTDERFRSEGGRVSTTAMNAINANVVGRNYFRTLGIPLLKGREFAASDVAEAPRVVIINETAVRLHFGEANPLGKHVSFDGSKGPWAEIVGIAGDSKYGSLSEQPLAIAYVPLSQNHETGVVLYVRTSGAPETLAGSLRREIQALEPNLPLPVIQTMQETIATSLYAQRMGATLLTAFGGLALLLAAIGVYSVLAFSISRRTKEMGIRFALGAERRKVFGLVVREGVTVAVVGLAGGLGVAWVAARALARFLYGVDPNSPLVFAAVGAALTAVILVACIIPARRAVRVNPVVALRQE